METPLAFAIVVHNQLGQLEALLASLFRPQNSYCLYLDKKTSAEFKQGAEKMVSNYKAKFPKVSFLPVVQQRAAGYVRAVQHPHPQPTYDIKCPLDPSSAHHT